MVDFISGALSGFSQVLVGHPLDTIKTRLQYNKPLTYKFNKLYRGLKYPLYTSVMVNTLLFKMNNDLNNYTNNYFVSGALTGVGIAFIRNPFELYKVKAQNNIKQIDIKKNIKKNKNIKNIKNNFKNIIKLNYRGIGPTLLREISAKSLFFGSYNTMREKSDNILLIGGLSGFITWSITYPFDVLKTRIQSNDKLTIKTALAQKNMWKGYVPCVIRSFIVNSIGFTVYEESKKYFEE